jgi:hypothetical protein
MDVREERRVNSAIVDVLRYTLNRRETLNV